MADTAQEKFLREQLDKAHKAHATTCSEWQAQEAKLQTDLQRVLDQVAVQAQRADLAEGRIGRLRNLLEHGHNTGARELARDIERKRRDR